MEKSKFLALLLAVAMVASMVVVPAYADPVATPPTSCAHGCVNPEWIPLEGEIVNVDLRAGHYYLSDDAWVTEGQFLKMQGVHVCLDLNGYSLTAAPDLRTMQVWGGETALLAIMDSSAAKTGMVLGNGQADGEEGGLIRVSTPNTQLHIYGGTFTGGSVYEGLGNGGGIYLKRGTKAYIKGGLITKNYAYNGGNVYVDQYAELYVSGDAVISNGVANRTGGTGGNICALAEEYQEPTVDISGNAQILGGSAYVAGNIDIMGSNRSELATLNISGNAQVTGGTIANPSKSNPNCVRVNNYTNVTVSGNALVDSMILTASTYANIQSGTINTLNVRNGNSTHNIYGGTIGVLCGNNHGIVTIHNGYIGEVYGGTKAVGEYAGYVETIAAAAVIDADATVLNFDETGMLVVHEFGNCATCNKTYTGNVDLKGKTMTVAEGTLDTSIGGNITDSVGGGKLVGSVLFNEENTMLPIETAANTYVLENVVFKSRMRDYTEGNATAKFDFYLDNAAAATAMDEALKAGKITIQVKVTGNGGEKIFALAADMPALSDYADNWDTKMLVLNLTGLENVENLECTAQVVANGVTVE